MVTGIRRRRVVVVVVVIAEYVGSIETSLHGRMHRRSFACSIKNVVCSAKPTNYFKPTTNFILLLFLCSLLFQEINSESIGKQKCFAARNDYNICKQHKQTNKQTNTIKFIL